MTALTKANFLHRSPHLILEYFNAIGPERTAAFYRDVLVTHTGVPTTVEAVKFRQLNHGITRELLEALNRNALNDVLTN